MATTSLTNTNINDTYVGVLHAKGAPIPPTGLEWVYDGFGNKSSLKIGRAGEGFDVDGSLGANLINAIADALYPIGSVIFSADNINPSTRFTNTTWTQISEGRFIAGVGLGNDGSNTQTIPAGNDSTGEYTHQLTVAEMPAHSHTFAAQQAIGGYTDNGGRPDERSVESSTTTNSTGSSAAHNNIPPAFGMYVWKRTA